MTRDEGDGVFVPGLFDEVFYSERVILLVLY